jgi:hypothetical protein
MPCSPKRGRVPLPIRSEPRLDSLSLPLGRERPENWVVHERHQANALIQPAFHAESGIGTPKTRLCVVMSVTSPIRNSPNDPFNEPPLQLPPSSFPLPASRFPSHDLRTVPASHFPCFLPQRPLAY